MMKEVNDWGPIQDSIHFYYFLTYILKRIWHDLSVTVDIMSLQFGHDVLQHFLPTMDRFSQKNTCTSMA